MFFSHSCPGRVSLGELAKKANVFPPGGTITLRSESRRSLTLCIRRLRVRTASLDRRPVNNGVFKNVI